MGPSFFSPLQSNLLLFIAILVSLHSTLRETQSDVSKVKYTRCICHRRHSTQQHGRKTPLWEGRGSSGHEAALVLEVIFLILTSQQGTFIFLVHCVLNDEVGPVQFSPEVWGRASFRSLLQPGRGTRPRISSVTGRVLHVHSAG
uniref:Secreted protein n=1 Tax=Denticeps clupeoides TaxID=299321 RepID=A0A8C4ASH5_9TELE